MHVSSYKTILNTWILNIRNDRVASFQLCRNYLR